MVELIITEKPSSARKVADALADTKAILRKKKQSGYYELTHNRKPIVVTSAVGHLFGLVEEKKQGWSYPVFDVKWEAAHKFSKNLQYVKEYIDTIAEVAAKADEFTIACDFDTEGEVIGWNVIRFACRKKDAQRMKFSTLTKPDLVEAYEHKLPHLEWGQALAGETRHKLDWFYGINLSRALTSSVKTAGSFKVMSIGRVQGPALKLLVEREKEIAAFKSEPYWQIGLWGNYKKNQREAPIEAWHIADKIFEQKEVERILKVVKGEKEALIAVVKRTQREQLSPFPFDLTTLQTEAYAQFKLTPKETLGVAQSLYLAGITSYPRTSSQQLDPKLGFRRILSELSKQEAYRELGQRLLKQEHLKPNNGKKTDPAHPAIFPTGLMPKALKLREQKVYDLIVKRFMATFAAPAVRETMEVTLGVKGELFVAKGTRTLQENWYEFYRPYVKVEEVTLPDMKEGEKVFIKEIKKVDKETQPPSRYNQSSIIKELERRNLGTKCLTADTLLKINSNNQIHHRTMAELFDSLSGDSPSKDYKGMKIALNNKTACFSCDEFAEIKSYFKMVSKRKLKKNETIYKIEYVDGSSIEATEEHPLLIWERDSGSAKYIPVKNITVGKQSVTSVKFPEQEGGIICNWDDFLKKCHRKASLYGISDEVQKIRAQQQLSQKALGKSMGLVQLAIHKYEKENSVPFYVLRELHCGKPDFITSENKSFKIKNPFSLKISSALVRILANLVGDGSINKAGLNQQNSVDFRYHNTNLDLINRFLSDVRKVFGIELKIHQAKEKPGHKPKYYVRIPAVVGRIILLLFEAVIKKDAVRIPSKFYTDYIGALFDDEGHAEKKDPKLFISNTNFLLLTELKFMLEKLGIRSILDEKQFKLYIRGRANVIQFLEKIPIASIEKKQRIINCLSQRYSWKEYPILKKERNIVALLNKMNGKELTLQEIATTLNIPVANTKETIKSLRKNGFIRKITVGISAYPRKRITYKLIKPIAGTIYTYIGESVISPDFITKTIASIKKVNYTGLVYDITNNVEIPNFILSNGVVVHNSTRAEILDRLFQRGYVEGVQITVTKLGMETERILEKYAPLIVDEQLTAHFEEDLEGIREGKEQQEKVLEEAKKYLTSLLADFQKKEKIIGEDIIKSLQETREEQNFMGTCPACTTGKLMIKMGKFGRFVACDRYPDCSATFKLPGSGLIKGTNKTCELCHHPMILIIQKRRRQEVCLNPLCTSKTTAAERQEIKQIEQQKVEKRCPQCGKDLLVRKSVYGSFLGCSGYPKCKHTEKLGASAAKKPEQAEAGEGNGEQKTRKKEQ